MSWKDNFPQEHRYFETENGILYNADCLDIMSLMEDKSVDLVLTDPPYNISQKSGGLREMDFGEWDKDAENKITFNALKEILRVKKGVVLVFCANGQISYIWNYFKSYDLITKILIWIKPTPSVINCQHSYVTGQEHIIYAKQRGAFFRPNYKLSYFKYPFPSKRKHPTEKPIKLIEELIIDNTRSRDSVLDAFLGSGTTALACEKLNRRWIGIEISEKYCKIAKQRIIDYNKQLKIF